MLQRPVPDDPEARHCGLLYRNDDGALRLLHLAWHDLMRDEPARESCGASAGWVVLPIPEERAEVVASFCSLLVERVSDGRVPYALSYRGARFHPERGTLELSSGEHGLTCATFVVAVLRGAGVHLLDEASWRPRPEDAGWQRKIVALLERHGAPEAHVDAVRSQVGCARIRPEEVAASAAATSVPASFEHATTWGPSLLERLRPPPG